MRVLVYLPGGADVLYVSPGSNILDAIYEAYGVYAEYNVIG